MTELRKKISFIVPFYNEEDGAQVFYETLNHVMDDIEGIDFEVTCVDDGSQDGTLAALIDMTERDARYRVIELSRNFGKEAAMTAGLEA